MNSPFTLPATTDAKLTKSIKASVRRLTNRIDAVRNGTDDWFKVITAIGTFTLRIERTWGLDVDQLDTELMAAAATARNSAQDWRQAKREYDSNRAPRAVVSPLEAAYNAELRALLG